MPNVAQTHVMAQTISWHRGQSVARRPQSQSLPGGSVLKEFQWRWRQSSPSPPSGWWAAHSQAHTASPDPAHRHAPSSAASCPSRT